jgi:hypothetical protein
MNLKAALEATAENAKSAEKESLSEGRPIVWFYLIDVRLVKTMPKRTKL